MNVVVVVIEFDGWETAGAYVFAGAIFNRGGRGGNGGAGGISGVGAVCCTVPGMMLICDASRDVLATVCTGDVCGRAGVCGTVILMFLLRGFINKCRTINVINVAATNEK